jgi:CMP/dCMP kinase
MPQPKINIAIDGNSACGKSTLAKSLASSLKYIYVDSGAMYRAVTWYLLQHSIDIKNSDDINKALNLINIKFSLNESQTPVTILNGEIIDTQIRSLEVSNVVSEVAAMSKVRQKLVAEQQKIGQNKGVVMDGRDISTVVFPNAELKIFMTASEEVRTLRRLNELIQKGISTTYEEVKNNLKHRDLIDSTREDSPLMRAPDAVLLDTSLLNQGQQLSIALEWALSIIAKKQNHG